MLWKQDKRWSCGLVSILPVLEEDANLIDLDLALCSGRNADEGYCFQHDVLPSPSFRKVRH